MRYEYTSKNMRNLTDDCLNEFGIDGWKLVYVIELSHKAARFFFMREMDDGC